MPAQDKTGPQGLGPKTGRQLGDCEGTTPIVGRGFGQGFGRGMRGFGRGCGRGGGCRRNFSLSKGDEKKILEAEKKEIESRLKELE